MFHRPTSRILLSIALFIGFTLLLGGCTNANSVIRNTTGADDSTGTASDTYQWAGTDTRTGTSTTLDGNQPPVIALKTSSAVVGYSSNLTLTAEAIDPEGEPLSYAWIASEGVFTAQNSNRATWKAPDKSVEMTIGCRVSDRKGASAQGTVTINVVGGRVYQLDLTVARSSLLSGNTGGESLTSEWMPLPQARVTLPALGQVLISDQKGKVGLTLDQDGAIASSSEVIVEYLDWEVRYQALFPARTLAISDQIRFYPGFDGVTVAQGRGDSFQTKRGGIEVSAFEVQNGQTRPVTEFQVETGSNLGTGRDGIAFMTAAEYGSDIPLTLSKPGYAELNDLQVPVAIDGVTLVQARLLPNGASPQSDAFVSWTRPFNGQKAVSVAGPFEIGFAQTMEQGTIFDDISMTIQNGAGSTVILDGAGIKSRFQIAWESPSVVRLYPRSPLSPLKRYSVLITRWNARAADGRMLRNYSGMFGTFTTDVDPAPSVTATNPRTGDTGVPRAGPFLVRFDRPMDPSTLASDLLLEVVDLVSGSKVSIDGPGFVDEFSAIWTENDTLLSLVPRRVLQPNRAYQIKIIRSNLRSRTGRAVQGLNQIWGQFTTGDL